MSSSGQPWTLNRWLGAAGLALVTIAGISLIVYGVVAGIRRRRVPKLHRPGEFYVGSEAVAEGVFRVVVGLLLVGFVAWMLRG